MRRRLRHVLLIVLAAAAGSCAGPRGRSPDTPRGAALRGDGFVLEIAPAGGMTLRVGAQSVTIESAWSYPGERIGHHRFVASDADDGRKWSPRVRARRRSARVDAGGAFYALERRIRIDGHRIRVSDTLVNTGDQDAGILIDHALRPAETPDEIRLCGAPLSAANHAENPTVFMRGGGGAVAVMAEDNISRVQFHAESADGVATFGLRHLALKPGARVTLDWTIYPFEGDADYFTFVNRLREDLGVNRTIPGPGGWFDATLDPTWSAISGDDRLLRAALDRNRLRLVLMAPWLDYENIHRQTLELIWRDEFKTLMRRVIETLHGVDPRIEVLASLEAPFVGLPDDLVDALYEVTPEPKKQGYYDMTEEMFDVFRKHPEQWSRWGDSLVYNRDGLTKFELYYREKRPLIALTVRPIVGNGQHEFLMEQARFCIEDVGFDGYYIDSFTGAQHRYYGYSYDRWDGFTVDIDPGTGKITRRYTDMALAGTGSRKAVIEYGVRKGKTVLVNGHPITRDTQSLGHLAFNESEWVFEPLEWMDGVPPWEQRPCEAHLSTPLALGFRPTRSGEAGEARYAEILTKGAIAYLRHGILYFHYSMAIPEDGPGSGGYGPFNHMFPITPVRLGEGFVEGKERIVTCVSKSFAWPGRREPTILLFDLKGRRAAHEMRPVRVDGGWRIDFELDDWQQIAVAAAAPPGDNGTMGR